MDKYQQGGAQDQSSNKKNRKKKKNKGQSLADNGGVVSGPQGDGSNTGGAEKRPVQARPGSQQGQLSASMDRGSRTGPQGQSLNSSSAQNRPDGRQHKEGDVNSNTNTNANSARGKDRGKTKPDKKPNKQDKEQHKASTSHKGQFTTAEGNDLLRKLAEHRIFELKKRNASFPNARFFCRLCDYHLDKPSDCERHVDESRHQRKKDALDMEGILEHIPQPSPQQIKALDTIVESIAEREGLSATELETRKDVASRLQSFIQNFKTDVILRLYGSSLSGVGLKGSDINIDVSGPGPAPALLLDVYKILEHKGAPKFINAQDDFTAKIPVMYVTDAETNFKIVLTINGQLAVLTSSLLQLYTLSDPRVQKLTVAMRIWAKICHLDRQEEGTLPPFAFNILVVYFLQQVQPPVLGLLPLEKIPNEGKGAVSVKMEDRVDFEELRSQAEAWQSENNSSIGELWLQLLRFYCLEFDNTVFVVSLQQQEPLTRQEKKWNSKKLAIEDPFCPRKNIANSLTNPLIFEYYQSCVRKTYEYFGMPRDKDGKVTVCLETLRALACKKTETLLNENQEDSTSTSHTSPSSSSTNQSAMNSPRKESAKKTKGKKESLKMEEKEESSGEVSDGSPVVIQSNKSIARKLKAAAGKLDVPVMADTSTEGSDINMTADSGVILTSQCEESSQSGHAQSVSDATADISTTAVSASEQDTTASSVLTLSMSECCNTASEITADSANGALSESVRSVSAEELPSVSEVSAVPEELPSVSEVSAEELPSVSEVSAVPEELPSVSEVSAVPEGLPSVSEASEVPEEFPSVSEVDAADGMRSEDDYKTSSETSMTARDAESRLSEDFNELKMSEAEEMQEEELASGSNRSEPQSEAQSAGDDQFFSYNFAESDFTGGKGPAVICGYCEQEGHIKADCPDDRLPAILPLPPQNQEHLSVLDNVITNIINDFRPTDHHVRRRQRVVIDLEAFVQQIYPDASFSLFGSSCNGFGFFSSDLDICMTFRGKTVEDIDVADVIEKVANKLKQLKGLYNIIPIPTAKVPIVKFTDRETRLEGDISLYNTLAQRNTQLLWCYSELDPRVKILGYTVKVFAKVCGIGDASRGSLSSYGYILMMLHYLQQCQPPVIPVLQQMHPEGQHPEHMVEGCNTWFFEALGHLPKVWRDFRKNRHDVATLWLGFLCYYVEEFDWKTMVVSIKQRAPLTKFEKMWNGNNIAIEDPFDLNHNLGGGLSRKMNNFIFKTFVNGRMHFGVPFQLKKDLWRRYRHPSEYFFDAEVLNDGKPPNDRGCRMCGKIGHLVRDCPNRLQNKRRQQAQNEKEAKEKNIQQGNPPNRKETKEPRGQGNAEVKNEKEKSKTGSQAKDHNQDPESQTSGQAKTQGDSKSPSKNKGKGREQFEGQGGAQPRGEGDQGRKQTKGHNRAREDAGSMNEGRGTRGDMGVTHQMQSSAEGKSAVRVGSSTASSSSSITTTAALTAATTTTTSGRMPLMPPEFSSTPQREPADSNSSSQAGSLPSPVMQSFGSPNRPKSSTPLQPGKTAGHPPGLQMDVQQLFSMAKQSDGSPVSLSPHHLHNQPRSPSGMPPNKLALTPEQQVAMLGGHSPTKGSHIPQQPGGPSHAHKGSPQNKMTPVSLMTLFQQPPTSQPQYSSSPPQRLPLPMMAMGPPLSHTPPANFPPQNVAPVSNCPSAPPPSRHIPPSSMQQMTPLPLNVLLPSQPQQPAGKREVDTKLEHHPNNPMTLRALTQASAPSQQFLQLQQQALQNRVQFPTQQGQKQFVQAFMQKIHEQNQPPPTSHAQFPAQSSSAPQQGHSSHSQPNSSHCQQTAQWQRPPKTSQRYQGQPGNTHHQQIKPGQNQPIGAQHQGQPVGAQHQGQPMGAQHHGQPMGAQHQSQPIGSAAAQQQQGQPHGSPYTQNRPDSAQSQGQPVQALQGQPHGSPYTHSRPDSAQSQGQPMPVQALQGQPMAMPALQRGQPEQVPIQSQQQFMQSLMQMIQRQQNQANIGQSSSSSHAQIQPATTQYPVPSSPLPFQPSGSPHPPISSHPQHITQPSQNQAGDTQWYQNQAPSYHQSHPEGMQEHCQPVAMPLQYGQPLPIQPRAAHPPQNQPVPVQYPQGPQAPQQQQMAYYQQQQQMRLQHPNYLAHQPVAVSMPHPGGPSFGQNPYAESMAPHLPHFQGDPGGQHTRRDMNANSNSPDTTG